METKSAIPSAEQLRSIICRIERLAEEKANILADIKEVYAEAKGNGFKPSIIRQIVNLRKMDEQDRQEQDELLAIYMQAVGL